MTRFLPRARRAQQTLRRMCVQRAAGSESVGFPLLLSSLYCAMYICTRQTADHTKHKRCIRVSMQKTAFAPRRAHPATAAPDLVSQQRPAHPNVPRAHGTMPGARQQVHAVHRHVHGSYSAHGLAVERKKRQQFNSGERHSSNPSMYLCAKVCEELWGGRQRHLTVLFLKPKTGVPGCSPRGHVNFIGVVAPVT